MKYTSTRGMIGEVTAAEAVTNGLAPDGGLYVPCEFPSLSADDIKLLCGMDYSGRASFIMARFLEGFSADEIETYCKAAYSKDNFGAHPAPVVKLADDLSILELWHGPTCAFKDMALQFLPFLLSASLKKCGEERTACILVATSGDTGKAALEGFRDVSGTKIVVFYPEEGVSRIQKLQMTTQEGENVAVCAVKGNFDHAQTGVKQIFSDTGFASLTDRNSMFLSSANSINWGRLLPQICYYFSAYCDMVSAGTISLGEKINICVPTGNFGNILASYYAKKVGLPVAKFICASNSNRVLTDFINTGVYDRNREFYQTISPSMDILISSNVERLLFDMTGNDAGYVCDCMKNLSENGRYALRPAEARLLSHTFEGIFTDDARTKDTIKRIFEEQGYLIDTHTAVGFDGYERYRKESGDKTPALIVSTASPYKFASSVLEALTGREYEPAPEVLAMLAELTGTEIPKPLEGLSSKPERFKLSIDPADMKETLRDLLSLK